MRSFLSILYIATIATASAVRNLTAGDIESFVAGHELSLVACTITLLCDALTASTNFI